MILWGIRDYVHLHNCMYACMWFRWMRTHVCSHGIHVFIAVYVCVCVWMYACLFVCSHYTHVVVCINHVKTVLWCYHVCVCVCVCECMHVCWLTWHTCTWTRWFCVVTVCVCVCEYMYVCTHAYIYVCVCVCVFMLWTPETNKCAMKKCVMFVYVEHLSYMFMWEWNKHTFFMGEKKVRLNHLECVWMHLCVRVCVHVDVCMTRSEYTRLRVKKHVYMVARVKRK